MEFRDFLRNRELKHISFFVCIGWGVTSMELVLDDCFTELSSETSWIFFFSGFWIRFSNCFFPFFDWIFSFMAKKQYYAVTWEEILYDIIEIRLTFLLANNTCCFLLSENPLDHVFNLEPLFFNSFDYLLDILLIKCSVRFDDSDSVS